ncbi:MAG: fructan beta-fructosidase [Maribacter sp.]|jgi:fructan beta-fructosidase
MFPLQVDGTDETKWVLLISINPGAPNGGSGTQYFIGDFDGITFTSDQTENRWLDFGRDNYAGVTYNNTPNGELICIGWMSNWDYARETPTENWRSASTVPRILSISKINGQYEFLNYPLKSFDKQVDTGGNIQDMAVKPYKTNTMSLSTENQSEIRFKTASRDFVLSFKNDSTAI